MMGVCYTYMRNSNDAKEVLQEGFIKVFACIDQFREQGSLEGWIRRIIVNTAITYYKQRKRLINHIPLEDVFLSAKEIANDNVISKMSEKELLEMVSTLPDKSRMVLNLYAIEGYSHEEISTLLDISIGTSKSQLNYARKKLLEKITASARVINQEENFTRDGRQVFQYIQA